MLQPTPSLAAKAKPKPPPTKPSPTSPPRTIPLDYRPRTVTPPRSIPRTKPSLASQASNILLRTRRPALYIAFLSVLGGTGYVAYIYRRYSSDAYRAQEHNVPLDVSDRYGRIAEHYDADIDWSEWFMGMGSLRRQLAGKATGHVLEAAVGTGRNAQYYPLVEGRVKSVTMVDPSPEMIRVARLNWPKTNAYFINASFRVQGAEQRVPCPDPEGFDTVLETMGVCSYPDPVAVLRNLGDMCKPETGRVLLLEHGRSHYGWLNRFLDGVAPGHADRYGCWFNKDVGRIVEESGLEVVEEKRFHLGTTWWFVLKPRPRPRPTVVETVLRDAAGMEMAEMEGRPWWASWWR